MEQNRMVRLAAIAGARVHRVAQRIQAEYPDPTMVTQEEAQQHFDQHGHYYDENHTHPFEQKWHGIVQGALAQVNGGQ